MRLVRFVLPAVLVAACRLAWPDTGEQPAAKATSASPPPGTVSAPLPQGSEPAPSPELPRILTLLAQRAELHHALLYRFQCTEELTRTARRRPDTGPVPSYPEETIHERCGIVVERAADGVATVVRGKLDRKGRVRLSRSGVPVEAKLPWQFGPVLKAVPHAQAATFTARGQAELAFRLLKNAGRDGPTFKIQCPGDDVAIEFLDRHPLRFLPVCSAQASGQMCVDPRDGEISALVFYGLNREPDRCVWDRKAPFAMVEQGLIETQTGARFPSRVRTIFSISRLDNAVFEQRYEDCGFTHVEVEETYGGVASGRP